MDFLYTQGKEITTSGVSFDLGVDMQNNKNYILKCLLVPVDYKGTLMKLVQI